MRAYVLAVFRQQPGPYLDVLVLDLSKVEIQGLLPIVGLLGRENAVQERRVGFVLPMVLEGPEIGS